MKTQDSESGTRQGRATSPAHLAGVAAVLLAAGVALGVGATWLAMHRTAAAPAGAAASVAAPLFQCPMHPTITSDHPGDCPICGMKLVEVKGGAQAAAEAQGGGASVDGRATVTIDPSRQQLIGLRTAPVIEGVFSGTWRTVGRIEVDPTRVRKTNLKVEGFVERLFVDFVGQPVRRGEPLFSLYSPSVLAAENEYVLALRTRDALAQAGSANGDGASLVAAAHRKLELWDVPAEELARLDRTREPSRTITFHSPVSGVVTAKNVVEGASVQAGDTPYEITDLGVVWVMADAYEGDVANVRVDLPAALTLKAYPGRTFRGMVAFVDPQLDPATRTTKVHMHFPNPGELLKPAMFGEVVLEFGRHRGLRVPADAVIRAGTKDVIFLALGDGKFAPREVQLGARDGGEVEVRGGLVAGDQVVTRANFLVDSESQLRASLAELSEKPR